MFPTSNYIINGEIIELRTHKVLIHPTPFEQQPTGNMMGKITNDLKKTGFSRRHSIQEIFERFSKGHSIILADVEAENVKSPIRFISTSMFAIDVDDTNMVTDPLDVLKSLEDKAVGLFYTFSHGIKGNRYRLVFQLSRSVMDERVLKNIIEVVAKELQKQGIPADTQAKNPTIAVRGGRHGYLINDYGNTLDVDTLLREVEKLNVKRQKEIYQHFKKDIRPIPFNVLKEMAEKVGYIPTGSGQGELWKRLVVGIKHYANTGVISQDEGFELFDIISGGEQSQRSWEGLRANGQATIGSLIHEAINRGYKGSFNYFADEEIDQGDYNRETIKLRKDRHGNSYIPTEVAEDILTSGQRVLVDSPTGSGKTTAFMTAMKNLENPLKDDYYIFAMPTIALTTQTANKHQVLAIKGQTKDLYKQINRQIWDGKRVFIATYDMVPNLIDFVTSILRKYKRQPKFYLVVDELHKFVTDYSTNYRHNAIQNLNRVGKEARTFVGLSGTIDDIYKADFDKVVHIDNGNPQSPCLEIASYIYEKRADALPELAKLIEVWTTRRKLLIYIQSKEKIAQLQNLLRRKGIKVRTISADSKNNPTYKQLVEHETIDEDVQVVLTTSVIADGVNINNDLEWEVIAVCNDFSRLFNPSSIKQISNRLRNPYRRFSVFMQKPRNEETHAFQIEGAFSYRKKIADGIVQELNEHPYFDPKLFRKSLIESRYGIYQTSRNQLEVDTLYLRHSVSIEQENYYMSYRYAFLQAIKKAFHYKSEIGEINISEEIRNNNLSTAFEQLVLKEMDEERKVLELATGETISQKFTEDVYKAFLADDTQALATFKKSVQARQYSCLKSLTKIADYETCMKVVKRVKRDADSHATFNDIRSLVDATYQQSVHRPTKTKKVLDQLLKLNEFIENKEMESEFERIAKAERIAKSDVKKACQLVQIENRKFNGTRQKKVKGYITTQSVAAKHELTDAEVVHMARGYSKYEKLTVQKVIETKLAISSKPENSSLF